MTKWLLIYSDGTVGRECRAGDKWAAEGILAPVRGQFVVSAASWEVSKMVTAPDPVPTIETQRKERLARDPEAAERRRASIREAVRKVRQEKKRKETEERKARALAASGGVRVSNILRGIEYRRARREGAA